MRLKKAEKTQWDRYDLNLALNKLDEGNLVLIYGLGNTTQAHDLIASMMTVYLGADCPYSTLKKTFRGKPYLTDSFFFNLSHTDKSFLIALGKNGEIGVDLEYKVSGANIQEMADYAFSPDERDILEKQFSENTFLRLWTLKEAYLKATGIGLIDALPTLHVVKGSDFDLMMPNFNALTFICPDGESGSLVCAGTIPKIFKMIV